MKTETIKITSTINITKEMLAMINMMKLLIKAYITSTTNLYTGKKIKTTINIKIFIKLIMDIQITKIIKKWHLIMKTKWIK